MKELFFFLLLLFCGILASPFVIQGWQSMGRSLAWNAAVVTGESLLAYNALLAESARRAALPAGDGSVVNNRITAYNASLSIARRISRQLFAEI